MVDTLTPEEGTLVLKLARDTIRGQLGLEPVFDKTGEEQGLRSEYATFVTIKKKGVLRGCIGSLMPTGTVYQSVRQNAIKSAFHDSRFPPLTRDEIEDIHIDISILTTPEPLEYRDGDDLINKLRPGIDGVTIRQGMASATFLPQVWQQLPKPEVFLDHLCSKAGLASTAWRDSPLDVEIYQVQCFEEESPLVDNNATIS